MGFLKDIYNILKPQPQNQSVSLNDTRLLEWLGVDATQTESIIKIDKDATTKRIDPVDATLCGYKLAMYHEFNSSFVDAIDAWLKSEW